MKADFDKALDKIAAFLGCSNLDEDLRRAIWERTNIRQMRESSMKGTSDEDRKKFFKQFFRKGETGDWKNHVKDPTLTKELEKYVFNNLKGTDIQFYC